MIHLACYTPAYEQLSTSNCLIFSHNTSLSEILGQATYRTCCKHIDPICPTFCCFRYYSLCSLQWLSSTIFQPGSVTSVLALSIWEHLKRHTKPGAPAFPEPECHSQARNQIHCLPPSRHHWHFHYPGYSSSQAKFRCRKGFQLHFLHHFRLDDGRITRFGGHAILEVFLQGGPLQTKRVAMVIFLTI